jgi:hypothetical protein
MKEQVNQYDLLEEMIRGRDERLKIQALEYERRLETLNHENERIMEILKQSVPREVFDKVVEGINSRIQINTDYMNATKGKGTGMNSLWVVGIAAVLVLCSIVTVIMAVLTYTKK